MILFFQAQNNITRPYTNKSAPLLIAVERKKGRSHAEATKEMFYNHTSKSGSGSIAYSQNKQPKVLLYPGVSPAEAAPLPSTQSPDDERTAFIGTLVQANANVDIDVITNAVHKYALGRSSAELRQMLCITPTDDLRLALKHHSLLAYQCVSLAEELIRAAIQNMIASQGVVSLPEIDKKVMDIARTCGLQLRDITRHHKINILPLERR